MNKLLYRMAASSVIVMLLSGLVSCKPTEKNYQAAYDAARLKKEIANAKLHEDVEGNVELQDTDGPKAIKSGNVTIFVVREPMKYFCGTKDELRRFNVAVACYSMPTNCNAQVENLIKAGHKAFGVVTASKKYYVVAGSFATLKEAQAFSSKYSAAQKPEAFVGLQGHPLLLEY